MSNHFHALTRPENEDQLADFYGCLKSRIARLVQVRTGWEGSVFARRYDDITVTLEPEAELERLYYLLSHGVKEGLVRKAGEWPGINTVKALCSGSNLLKGKIVDRRAFYEAMRKWNRSKDRLKKDRPSVSDFTIPKSLELAPLPSQDHLTHEQRSAQARAILDRIHERWAETRKGVSASSRRRILLQSHLSSPSKESAKKRKRKKKPRVHAASRSARVQFCESMDALLSAYRRSSALWRNGDLEGVRLCPAGMFLPGWRSLTTERRAAVLLQVAANPG